MTALQAQQEHLANLLTAVQRNVYFLAAAEREIPWPLDAVALTTRKKDESLYLTLSAFNERYSKLQDLLGVTMRHAAFLLGERTDEFLHVLVWFEKQGVIDSVENWQLLRLARNQAAHEYETDYETIADHFNTLFELLPTLHAVARRLTELCKHRLMIGPSEDDFAHDFENITGTGLGAQKSSRSL